MSPDYVERPEYVERLVMLIVLNAANLPPDARQSFIAAACRDLEEGGLDANSVQQVGQQALKTLDGDHQKS